MASTHIKYGNYRELFFNFDPLAKFLLINDNFIKKNINSQDLSPVLVRREHRSWNAWANMEAFIKKH